MFRRTRSSPPPELCYIRPRGIVGWRGGKEDECRKVYMYNRFAYNREKQGSFFFFFLGGGGGLACSLFTVYEGFKCVYFLGI